LGARKTAIYKLLNTLRTVKHGVLIRGNLGIIENWQ
jgi:hypothetical protein